jgi:hypothetical protein
MTVATLPPRGYEISLYHDKSIPGGMRHKTKDGSCNIDTEAEGRDPPLSCEANTYLRLIFG